MRIRCSTSTKLMAAGIVLSLGWFALESCECDETKEEQFPGFWVACIGNKPTLMTYLGDHAAVFTSDSAGNFNPSEWDCSNPNSPNYKGSQKQAPFTSSGAGGPAPGLRKPHDATSQTVGYLPRQIRSLPFVPFVAPPASPTCDSSQPDVYRAIHTLALVTRFSTCPFKIVATIPVVTRPLQIELTPDGATALVTSFDNAVNFIDAATNKVTFTLKTDISINPHGLAISPDGTRAYVTSFNATNPEIIVIDLATKAIIGSIPTNVYPQGATLTPDGSQLWITSPLTQSVDIFDTLSNTRVTSLAIAQTVDVAFTADGTRAFITSQSTVPGTVVEVNTSTYQTVTTYKVGSGPTDISMSYADEFLAVNNAGDGTVSVIDLVKGTVSASAKIGDNPTGIAFVH